MATKKKITIRGIGGFKQDMNRMNKLSRTLLDSATNSDTSKRDAKLDGYIDALEEIISADFKRMSIYSSEDLSKFLVDFLQTDSEKKGSFNLSSIEDIFENESNGLMSQFQNKFQSDLLLFEELSSVTSQFYELQEAIDVTRDSILTADEQSNSISRELLFPSRGNGDNVTSNIAIVEQMEKENKIFKKIKSHIVPNTLRYGRYYVYTVPYSYIYTKHAEKKARLGITTATEAMDIASITLDTQDTVIESFVKEYAEKNDIDLTKVSAKTKREVKDTLKEYMEAFTIEEDDIPLPVMENAQEIEYLMDAETKKSMAKASRVNKAVNDGVYDPTKMKKSDTDYSNVVGCYMKLIDPRKMIPVEILDQVVGYYYIHEQPTTKNRSPFSSSFRIDLTKGYAKKEDNFIDQLSDKIVKSFNKPFLEKNIKFKKSIAAALTHGDVKNKNIRFQFIPVEYVTEFKINEDENGKGTSMIQGSLFYAKLYLALLYFNMITILSKSNDQRLYYIHQSGVDKNIAKKVQNAAREIKAREMNYSDLFNYKSMVSKVGAGRDAFIPVGTDDRRAISFDILAGQAVELHSDLMTMLKTSAINTTGVPSVIMNYVNEADYAKSIVMGNLRHLARVVGYQVDFNEGLTDLYRKLLRFSTTLEEDVIDTFEFKLAKPRSLDATNLVEILNNSVSLSQQITESMMGENSNPTDTDNKAKDLTQKKILKSMTTMIPWAEYDEILHESYIEAKKLLEATKDQEA